MKLRSLIGWALALGCVLCFPACSRHRIATTLRGGNLKSYSGSLKPKDAVSHLTCGTKVLEIASVDGETIKKRKARTGHVGGFSYVELLPGEHTFNVKGSTFHTSQRRFHTDFTIDLASFTVAVGGESKLDFRTEPGHVYIIDVRIERNEPEEASGEPTSHSMIIFVKDARTKQIAARVVTDLLK